jgi:hypothetical protein
MQLFHIHYDGVRYPVFASNHVAARRLGTRHLANILSVVDTDKVVVVDPAVACATSYEPIWPREPRDFETAFREVQSGGHGFF